MMDLIRLRTFRAVVAEGSVNGAAVNLGYTASAVSQQIHALQKDTGLELFKRNGRGIEPTAIGRRFAQEAEPLLQQAKNLDSLATDLRSGRTGTLSLSHISSVGAAWMPPIVAEMGRQFPEVRLELSLWETTQGVGMDPDLEINLVPAGNTAVAPEPRAGYATEELITEPYVVVLPSDHPLAGRDEIRLTELTEETWIDNDVMRGLCRQILIDACATQGFIPPFQVQTQDDRTAVAFVEAGVGITVMPELSFAASRADLQKVTMARMVEPAPARTIIVRTKETKTHMPSVLKILELLREQARV